MVDMSMTLRRGSNPDPTASDSQPPEAETRMRRALGLLPSAAPRARARGGDGPVVEHRGDRQGGSSVNRVAAAEAALAEERHAREQLARQLRDAETASREAQTKWGHVELARDEALAALAAERGAKQAAEEQVRQLQEQVRQLRDQIGQLEEQVRQVSAVAENPPIEADAPTGLARATRRRAAVAPDPAAAPKRRGRPPGSKSSPPAPQAPEPESDEASEAVEWWVPGWKERV